MLGGWWRTRTRNKIRRRGPPTDWYKVVSQNVWQFDRLASCEQAKILEETAIVVAEKNWEGCGGLQVTEEMQVIVAAQMALLAVGFTDEFFDRVLSILLYPDAYVAMDRHSPGNGLIVEGPSERLGEAWYRGPVILSWPDVLEGGQGPNYGRNLVFHEFAHQLDMLNGRTTDGVPPMESAEQAERWIGVCTAAYDELVRACSGGGGEKLMDCYGATNKAEFFAVATEMFFQTPRRLQSKNAEMFRLFKEYYAVDPLRWAESRPGAGL